MALASGNFESRNHTHEACEHGVEGGRNIKTHLLLVFSLPSSGAIAPEPMEEVGSVHPESLSFDHVLLARSCPGVSQVCVSASRPFS